MVGNSSRCNPCSIVMKAKQVIKRLNRKGTPIIKQVSNPTAKDRSPLNRKVVDAVDITFSPFLKSIILFSYYLILSTLSRRVL